MLSKVKQQVIVAGSRETPALSCLGLNSVTWAVCTGEDQGHISVLLKQSLMLACQMKAWAGPLGLILG